MGNKIEKLQHLPGNTGGHTRAEDFAVAQKKLEKDLKLPIQADLQDLPHKKVEL